MPLFIFFFFFYFFFFFFFTYSFFGSLLLKPCHCSPFRYAMSPVVISLNPSGGSAGPQGICFCVLLVQLSRFLTSE